jgi:hypothetical protein
MKTLLILILATIPALARIGETPEQCTARYGKPISDDGSVSVYVKAGFIIVAQFHQGKAEMLLVGKQERDILEKSIPMSAAEIKTVLDANANGSDWELVGKVIDQEWATKDKLIVAVYKPMDRQLTIATEACLTRSAAEKAAKEKQNLEGF